MEDSENLYNTLLNPDDEFDPVTSTLGLMYNHLNVSEMSQYYDLDKYNASIPHGEETTFNIMHFNIRSLTKNGDELLGLLQLTLTRPGVGITCRKIFI